MPEFLDWMIVRLVVFAAAALLFLLLLGLTGRNGGNR